MKSVVRLALTVAIASAPLAASANGGRIATLPVGAYACELPGRADGPAGLSAPKESFEVLSGSTYRAAEGRGLYLYAGKEVAMTSGPLKGARYVRQSDGFLRRLDDKASPSPLRCVRSH